LSHIIIEGRWIKTIQLWKKYIIIVTLYIYYSYYCFFHFLFYFFSITTACFLLFRLATLRIFIVIPVI
jgi:hypothetical protein